MKWFFCSLIIMSVLSLGGCGFMTPKTEEETFTMLEKRAERHDKILGSRARCKAKGLVWWLNPGFSTYEIRKMKNDLGWLPRGAHPTNFACVTSREAMDAVNRMLNY